MLSDPNKTVETIKEIGKKFKGKNASQIVDQLFGKKEGDGTTARTRENKENAKELLNKFLGKEQRTQIDGDFVIADERSAAHSKTSIRDA